MGTIRPRKRSDGTTGYTAQIRLKRGGKIVYTEAQTFDRRAAATAWMARREGELAEPGALDRVNGPDPLLHEVIDHYIAKSRKAIGRTKTQVLKAIKTHDLANKKCSEIGKSQIAAFADELGKTRQPQTVSNYISHLSAIFAVAKPLWDYPLDPKALEDATVAMRKIGIISRSKNRERRPTLDELDKLMVRFGVKKYMQITSPPMQMVSLFAIFSTRRQEEIVRLKWSDLDEEGSRILVRDMKHPEEKDGNNVWCELTPEALKVVRNIPRVSDRIFPYTTDAVSAAFTRACKILGIVDLHFHDLRHEGISRLFEMGRTIPQVASVSGHRSWASLKRYSHLRQIGDKYAGWKWLEAITASK
jgi:integrase